MVEIAEWHATLAFDHLSEGWVEGVTVVTPAGAAKLILLRNGNAVCAYRDACPHEGFPLSETGIIEDGVLICGKHLWEFDVATGKHISRLERPECNLKRYPVRVADGVVEVDVRGYEAPRPRAHDDVIDG